MNASPTELVSWWTSLHSLALRWRIRASAFAAAFLLLYAGASAIASLGDRELAPLMLGKTVTLGLELPTLEQQAAALDRDDQVFSIDDRLRPGDSVGGMFLRMGINDPAAARFIKSDTTARRLLQVRTGTSVSAQVDNSGNLRQLRFLAPSLRRELGSTSQSAITVERSSDGFVASELPVNPDVQIEMRAGTIRSSLFGATDAAGIPDAVTMQIADLFSGDIDFHGDLRKGDQFRVIYETLNVSGEFLRSGRVLAAEFVVAGKTHRAAWFESAPGHGSYYDENGRSLRKAFLRSPLEFSRVSSGFSNSRFHPISFEWKKHNGVDFGAPIGTPVRATADGVVQFSGWQNGFGNVVIVRHAGQFESVYAHLSRIAPSSRRGARVEQGQFIGQVGMTGSATGPHLHYEFHVAGQPRDPMKVALPEAGPIEAKSRTAFAAAFAEADDKLALMRDVQVAQR
jgi:murein DD-endopeptidase MepM/ murein hydrolase activator NlpD